MNALVNALWEPKERAVPPVVFEVPDYDDAKDMRWDAYVEARQAHREALGRRFAPTTKEKKR